MDDGTGTVGGCCCSVAVAGGVDVQMILSQLLALLVAIDSLNVVVESEFVHGTPGSSSAMSGWFRSISTFLM